MALTRKAAAAVRRKGWAAAVLQRPACSGRGHIVLHSLLPARRRPQGLVIIGVCLSVRTVFVRKISQERVHESPPNLVGGSRG